MRCLLPNSHSITGKSWETHWISIASLGTPFTDRALTLLINITQTETFIHCVIGSRCLYVTPDVLRVSGVIERFLPFLLVVIDISLTVCLQLVVIVQHLLVLYGLARV